MSRKTFYNTSMSVKRLKLDNIDSVGGISPVKITVYSKPCRIRQLDAEELSVGGKDGVVSTHRIYCDVIKVKNKDEIVIGKRIYDVNSINPGSYQKNSLEIDTTIRY